MSHKTSIPADPADASSPLRLSPAVLDHRFYRASPPPAPLREHIASFWLYDGYRPADLALPAPESGPMLPISAAAAVPTWPA